VQQPQHGEHGQTSVNCKCWHRLQKA
jgi:hypothetical protein